MDSHMLLPERLMDDAVPLAFVVMMISLVVLPAVTLGIARKWSSNQPQIAPGALTAAAAICIVGILSAALVTLAILGWLPPPDQWVRRGA